MARHPGEILEVEIEKVVNRGLGLARVDGAVCLVHGAYAGERCRVGVSTVGRGHVEAVALEVLRPHPQRRVAACPAFPTCGGCAHLDLDASAQREIKRVSLGETLARAGVRWDEPIDVVSSPETGWRTRASLHVSRENGRLELGFRRSGGHQVVPVEECLQLSTPMNQVARRVQQLLAQSAAHQGVERVDLAESSAGDQRVLTFEGQPSKMHASSLRECALDLPGVTGVGIATPRNPWRRLAGDPFIVHRVGGLVLRAHARSFFQSNRFLVDALVTEVMRHAPEGVPVLDLYSGVGLFAVALAGGGHATVAVEGNPIAVADARANARAAGCDEDRLLVVGASVERALGSLPVRSGELVVVDPPRAGLGRALVHAIASRRPSAVVYVSCDPATLARDLADLVAAGLSVSALRAFDLFPGTFHIETVAALIPGR